MPILTALKWTRRNLLLPHFFTNWSHPAWVLTLWTLPFRLFIFLPRLGGILESGPQHSFACVSFTVLARSHTELQQLRGPTKTRGCRITYLGMSAAGCSPNRQVYNIAASSSRTQGLPLRQTTITIEDPRASLILRLVDVRLR